MTKIARSSFPYAESIRHDPATQAWANWYQSFRGARAALKDALDAGRDHPAKEEARTQLRLASNALDPIHNLLEKGDHLAALQNGYQGIAALLRAFQSLEDLAHRAPGVDYGVTETVAADFRAVVTELGAINGAQIERVLAPNQSILIAHHDRAEAEQQAVFNGVAALKLWHAAEFFNAKAGPDQLHTLRAAATAAHEAAAKNRDAEDFYSAAQTLATAFRAALVLIEGHHGTYGANAANLSPDHWPGQTASAGVSTGALSDEVLERIADVASQTWNGVG